MKKWNLRTDFGYYPSRIFVYSCVYYVINVFDLILTKKALETCEHVYELNPFYYHSLFALLKPFAPVCLLSLYFFFYFVTKSERDRTTIGKWGLGCIMAVVFAYVFVCINNVYCICIAGV
jgi:hypothetical protein